MYVRVPPNNALKPNLYFSDADEAGEDAEQGVQADSEDFKWFCKVKHNTNVRYDKAYEFHFF